MTSNSEIINNEHDSVLINDSNSLSLFSDQSLKKFINKYYSNDNYSHVGMDCQSGKFNFGTKIEKFYVKYVNSNSKHILEVRQPYSQFVIDIDIQKTQDEYENQLWIDNKFYYPDHVKALITVCQQEIKKTYLGIKDIQLDAVLLEKDIYQKNENTWKGGLHIQFPNLYVKTETIKNSLIPSISEELKKIEGMPKEFIDMDIPAMCVAPWLLYGSTKSADSKPYLISKIFNCEQQEMTVTERLLEYKIYDTDEAQINLNAKNLEKNIPRIFSINPSHRPVNEIKKKYDNPKAPVKKEKKEKKEYVDNRSLDEIRIEVKKLLSCLKSFRADDRIEWLKVAWILWGISDGDDEFFDMWNEWSSQSDSYKDEEDCRKVWDGIKPRENGVTIGTLKAMAKEDNEILYNSFFKNWVKEFILNSTDKNAAELFAKYSEGEIFYTTSHNWTIFDKKTRFWNSKQNDKSLIYPICDFFSGHIKQYMIEYMKSYDSNNKDQENFFKLIHSTYKKVGMSKFASGIIQQLQSLVTETNDIFQKFESNPALFAFSDGYLIDLNKNGEVRQIEKEDKIFIHCGYSLPQRQQNDIDLVKNFLRTCVETDDDFNCLLSLLSCYIYGQNINEKCFLMTGTGGNSKGCIAENLRLVLGNYFGTVDMGQFTSYEKDSNRANSDIASCQFSRCMFASEPDEHGKFISNQIKKHTGRDPISVRFLGKDKFTFLPKYTTLFHTNICLSFSGDVDAAIKRRIVNYSFPYEFVTNNGQELKPNERYGDVNLKTEMTNNPSYRNGLLWILVDTWIQNKGKFITSKRVIEDTQRYLSEQNPVLQWFLRNYEKDENGRIGPNTLQTEYQNLTSDYMSVTKFGKFMMDCCDKVKSDGKMKYKCKRISNTNDDVHNNIPDM